MAWNSRNNHKRHTEDALPSLRRDLLNAKLFLQQSSSVSGDSLYEHLSRIIGKVINERPLNVVDYFEAFSERVRLENLYKGENEMMLNDAYEEPQRLAIAKRLLPMIIEKSRQHQQAYVSKSEMKSITASDEQSSAAIEADEENEERSAVIYYEAPASVTTVKDLCELQSYWNLLGIGFPREEIFLLSCAMLKLKTNASIATCRFWGKLFGISSDYYIVECTLTEDALESRIDAIEKAINMMNLESPSEEFAQISDHRESLPSASSEKAGRDGILRDSAELAKSTPISNSDLSENDNSDSIATATNYPTGWNFSMKIPQTSYRASVEIPAEEIGHGVNRHVYYVCNNLGEEWIELPSAKPHQINVSRRIRKYLTGNLDAHIASYPIFPGTERNYLRAIIARISAATHVAPRNFYRVGNETREEDEFDNEEEDGDDDESNNDKPIKVNESYYPLPIEKLLKLDYWQHIKPEILKQGRICYFDGQIWAKYHNNNNNNDNENNDDEEASIDEEESNSTDVRYNKIQTEMPAPLFASCYGDRLTNDTISPWTIRLSDVVESPLVFLQSNIWPGAFAFAKERICDNIYIGFGHKYSSVNYSPLVASPQFQSQFPNSLNIEEANVPRMETANDDVEDDNDADEVKALKINENQ